MIISPSISIGQGTKPSLATSKAATQSEFTRSHWLWYRQMKEMNQVDAVGDFVPRTSPERGKARCMDVPDGFTEAVTRCFDYDIYSVSAGPSNPEGLPILMIHGALVSRRYLLPTAELLCHKYRVILPDLVGHGGSSKPKRTLGVQEQAAILAEFLHQNGIEKAYVFANSYGCEVAVHLTANYPEFAERLILIGPTCDRSAPHLFLQFIRLCIDGIYEHPSMGIVLLKDLWEMGLMRAIRTSQIMIDYKTLNQVPKIQCPTLIVRGSRDAIAPEEWTHKVVRAFTVDVRYIPVHGAPHNVNYSAAPILNNVIDDFLSNKPIKQVPKAA